MLKLFTTVFKSSPYYMGFGAPIRSSSYILGYQPFGNSVLHENDNENRRYRKSENGRKRYGGHFDKSSESPK